MPIRKPHVSKAAITKRHVEDALKFKTLDHILLCRGAGANITGNAGTSYGGLLAAELIIDPTRYKEIMLAEVFFFWNPETTAGGIRVQNITDGTTLASSEPGVAGFRRDSIDVTSTWKTLTGSKRFEVQTKGDGTTAPTIASVYIVVQCGNV